MITEFFISLFAYKKGIISIVKYNLYKYALAIILLLVFFIVPVILIGETASFLGSYIPFIDGVKYAKIASSFLASLSGFILLLILTPVFTLVSDEVNFHLKGIKNKFSLNQFLKDIFRGVKITFRNFVYQYITIALLLLFLNILPSNVIITIFTKIIILIITSYFYGFSLLDYAMENHKMNYTNSVSFVRNHKSLTIGLGFVYYAIISVNDLELFHYFFGNLSIYWSALTEALIAFIGVITASIVLNAVNNDNKIF